MTNTSIEEKIQLIGHLPAFLRGPQSETVGHIARILELGDLLPHEDEGESFQESDFLMSRRFLILLLQTYETMTYIHVNDYGGIYGSHRFLLKLIQALHRCQVQGRDSAGACPFHRDEHRF